MGLSFAESSINWLATINYPWSRCLLVSIPKRMQVSVHDLIYICFCMISCRKFFTASGACLTAAM